MRFSSSNYKKAPNKPRGAGEKKIFFFHFKSRKVQFNSTVAGSEIECYNFKRLDVKHGLGGAFSSMKRKAFQ